MVRLEICAAAVSFPIPEAQWHRWIRPLPGAVVAGVSRLRRNEDRQRTLLGKLLLWYGAKRFGYPDPLWPDLFADAHGKPRLTGPLEFNISHSGEHILCALSDGGPVGIDVEQVDPLGADHLQDFLSTQEWHQIQQARDPVREGYRLWTMKEAALKADGRALAPGLEVAVLAVGRATVQGREWILTEIPLGERYAAFLAHTSGQTPFYVPIEFS